MQEQEKQTAKGRDLYEWVQSLVGSVLVVVAIFTFVIRMMGVDGHSMLNTLQHGDRLLVVNSMLYHDYKYGDIVILRKNGVFDDDPIVKRVIAVEGQTVDIDFAEGIVYVDGEALEEDYIREPTYTAEGTEFPLTVPEGSIFVMGDNRNGSSDSRDYRLGTVDTRYVIGKAAFLIFPGPDYERQAWNSGAETVCGVDEAGAGPLMGPVYAAAVILPGELDIPGLNDSKKLTEKKREALYEVITTQAVSWSVTRVEAWEIDEMDILNARMLAMQRAIEGLSVRPDTAFIDGNRDHGSRYAIETPHQLIVGGDGKSASIAAASILAKVSRDRYVSGELDAKYPQYQFAKHKGYGTKLHYAMLDQYGPCPEHRRSFLKKWEAKRHG